MNIVGKVTATINGQPVELENVSIAPKREAEHVRVFGETVFRGELTFDAGALYEVVKAVAALMPPRYWQRRHRFGVRQFRRHMARALGVNYRDMRHFCRTGKWPRSPMRLSVDPRMVAVELST